MKNNNFIIKKENIKTAKLLILTCALSLNTVFAQENKVNDDTQKAYEMPRTQVIQISNSETDTLNRLYIKLPKGYEKNTDLEYPVIYFTFPKEYIEILSAVTEILIEDVIIVGLTWSKGINFGNLDSYVNFLRNDAFKVIENNYRADANRRTYFGYSAGALVGAYILSKHPNTFKNFILGSPALAVDHEVIQKIYEIESTTAEERKKLNANVFISYGILEEKDTPHFEKFITMLKSINDESLTLQHIVVEGDHQTSSPMTAIRSIYWLSDLIKE
ncbi:alpha/beta hydrolase [Aquimarina macrocephali]|uniref:alpha/beta hydrolase n=1 Tax=Aquimarina macrocephali TaxID=666563 RepID=UPI000463C824|nr:alpha/beta hydrolase-fold protein [Aquimarina macrocephali]